MKLAYVFEATNDEFLTVHTQLYLDNFALVMVVDFLVISLIPESYQVDGASLRYFVVSHEVNGLGRAYDWLYFRHKLFPVITFKYDLFAIFTTLT